MWADMESHYMLTAVMAEYGREEKGEGGAPVIGLV